MINTQIVPYETLESNNWTVNALLMSINVNMANRISLKDMVELNRQKLSNDQIEENSVYRYLEISSIDPETGIITEYKEMRGDEFPSRARLVAQKDDVLLSTIRPERGAIAIVPDDLDGCIVTNGFVVITPKKVSSEVLYFLFRSEKVLNELGHLVKGTTIPMVSLKQLKEYLLPIKTLTEIDGKYAKDLYSKWLSANQSSESLQKTVERVFLQYLGLDFEQVLVESNSNYTIMPYSRLEDRLDVDYYVHQSSSKQEWDVPVNILDDVIANFILGVTVSTEEYSQAPADGVPYIRIKDIDDDLENVSIGDFAYISKQDAIRHSDIKTSAKDILIARVGGTLGKSALVQESLAGSIVNQHLVILRASKKILPEYLLYYFKSSWARDQFNSRAAGSVQQFIRMEQIKEVQVPLPSREVQQHIVVEINRAREHNDLSSLRSEVNSFTDLILND